ncbi:MAG: carboxylesterase family protein [Acidobacteriota bacterium]
MQTFGFPRNVPILACLLSGLALALTGCASQGAGVPVTATGSEVSGTTGAPEAVTCNTITPVVGVLFYGSPSGSDACIYRGIQYATAARWQPPKVQLTQGGGNQGNAFGPVCPQESEGSPIGDEQCLYLNVWRKAGTGPKDGKQVMVYIHGGAFISGSGGSSSGANLFDGSYFAGIGDVILVTFNYRLGALGSLFADGMTGGNYGLMDQEAALEWVRNNIRTFGGDPLKIMVFGESAGAMSVGLHLMSTPRAQGRNWRFQSALMESNPLGLPYKSLSDAKAVGSTFVKKAGPLANLTVSNILTAQKKVSGQYVAAGDLSEMLAWAPSVDGQTVLSEPMAGKLPLPTVLGTNRDEGILFAYGALAKDPSLFDDATYKARLTGMFGATNAARVEALPAYEPKGDRTRNAGQMSNLINDYMFTCANADLAGRSAAAQVGPYLYRFTHVPEINLVAWVVPQCAGKVCHAAELPFVFHDDDGLLGSAAEKTLSANMSGYWSTFAKTQAPGSSPMPWPAYGATGSYLDLDLSLAAKTDPAILSAANCAFWKSVGYGAGSMPPARLFRATE